MTKPTNKAKRPETDEPGAVDVPAPAAEPVAPTVEQVHDILGPGATTAASRIV